MHRTEPLYRRIEDYLYEVDVLSAMHRAECLDWIISGVHQGYLRELSFFEAHQTIYFSTPHTSDGVAQFILGRDGVDTIEVPADIIQGILSEHRKEWIELQDPTLESESQVGLWDTLNRLSDMFTEKDVLVGHLVIEHDLDDLRFLRTAPHDDLLELHQNSHRKRLDSD